MRKIIWLGVAVMIVVALWTAGWFWASGEIRRQVALLAEADGETTPRITCGNLSISGFPFRFDAECRDGTLTSGDTTMRLTGLKASVLVYSPTHVIFSAQAPASLADAFTGSESRLDFTGLEGSARLETGDIIKGMGGVGWRIARISVVADSLVWNDTTTGDLLRASADHVEAHLLDIPGQYDKARGLAGLATYLRAKGLTVPLLQITSGETALEAELLGVPDDIQRFADPDAIRNWQQAGGSFKLARFTATQAQPDESFEISGEARLSEAGLVEGQLDYRTKGVLDRFASTMPPLQLAAFKGKPEADGTFSNSLTVVDGQIRLLAIPLADLPPLF